MMHVLAISDLHGYLPDIPKCDLLLLGGDYCPTRNPDQERRFILGPFKEWLQKIDARYIVGIAGNHDFIFQYDKDLAKSLPWIYLEDEGVELETIRIYGSPWTPIFGNMAFLATEAELETKFAEIPEGLDILLTHGPAYRKLDNVAMGTHVGSYSLWSRIKNAKPNSHVFGHIHECRGIMDDSVTRYYNVTHVRNTNQQYEPSYGPMHISLRAE